MVRTEFCGLMRTLSWEMDLLGGLTISICFQVDAGLLSLGETVQDRLQDELDSRYDGSSRSRISRLGNNLLSISSYDVHCRSDGYLHVTTRQMACSQSRAFEQSVNWSRAIQLKMAGDCLDVKCTERLPHTNTTAALAANLAVFSAHLPAKVGIQRPQIGTNGCHRQAQIA